MCPVRQKTMKKKNSGTFGAVRNMVWEIYEIQF